MTRCISIAFLLYDCVDSEVMVYWTDITTPAIMQSQSKVHVDALDCLPSVITDRCSHRFTTVASERAQVSRSH